MENTPPSVASAERLVHVDGRTISVRAWEQELILRCAAWIVIVQAAIVASWPWLKIRSHLSDPEWRTLGACAALTVGGILVVVRSPWLRLVLAGSLGGFLAALLFTAATFTPPSVPSAWVRDLAPTIPGLVGLGGALLLLLGRPLGRDLLVVISFGWLVLVTPRVWTWLFVDHVYEPMRGGQVVDRRDGWGALAVIVPPLLVFADLLAAPGRSLLPVHRPTARLAPLSSLRRGGPTLVAWGAVTLLITAVALSAYRLEALAGAFQR